MQDAAEATRRKNAARSRDRRFRTHFQRWLRGKPIRTYDTRWLAYLEEQLSSAEMNKAVPMHAPLVTDNKPGERRVLLTPQDQSDPVVIINWGLTPKHHARSTRRSASRG
jgi:hypothetical protein